MNSSAQFFKISGIKVVETSNSRISSIKVVRLDWPMNKNEQIANNFPGWGFLWEAPINAATISPSVSCVISPLGIDCSVILATANSSIHFSRIQLGCLLSRPTNYNPVKAKVTIFPGSMTKLAARSAMLRKNVKLIWFCFKSRHEVRIWKHTLSSFRANCVFLTTIVVYLLKGGRRLPAVNYYQIQTSFWSKAVISDMVFGVISDKKHSLWWHWNPPLMDWGLFHLANYAFFS